MDTMQMLIKYAQYTEDWMDKEAKLANFIERWLYDDLKATPLEMQGLFDTINAQIKEVQKKAEKVLMEYLLETRKKVNQANSLKFSNEELVPFKDLEKDYNDGNINIAKSEIEKGRQLQNIKLRIMKKEIDFVGAKKLLDVVKETYKDQEAELLELLGQLKM